MNGDSPFARYAITSGAPNGPPVVTIDGPTGMLGDTSTDAKDTLTDALGSPLGQYDSAGALTGVRSYDAFGGQLQAPNTVSTPSVQQGWMGNRDVDPAQGVSDFNARAFGAEDGRFMGVDPVEGIPNRPQTLNPYQHGTNNPYRYPDANGQLGLPSLSDVWSTTKGGLNFAASVAVPCYDLGKHYLSDSGSHDNTSWGALDKASAVAGCVPGIGKAGSFGLKAARSVNHLRTEARIALHTGGGTAEGIWAKAGTNVVEGGSLKQTWNGSCVSSCGQMLSEGNKLEADIAARIGGIDGDATKVDFRKLANELGPEWVAKYIFDPDELVKRAQSGSVGLRVNAFGEEAHLVVSSPIGNGKFQIRDPAQGKMYDVDEQWIRKYGEGAVWKK